MNNFNCIKSNILKYEDNYSKYATKSNMAIRLRGENIDIRGEFERDSDKIIHSLSYTRYIDKTQVYPTRKNDNISKRMTHVQFVSRTSRTIARALNLNEDLCEAIALGHDIGHVPYGHEGEYILNEISKEELGEVFAHNVQGVREFLCVENNGYGINLCIQTLDGILCHNGEFLQDKYCPKKKSVEEFFKEYEQCYKEQNYIKSLVPMTMEGCIVRISDIISYIGKDIEDAIRLGKIKIEDVPKDIVKILGATNKDIMHTVICDVIENSYEKDYICMSVDVYNAIKRLKQFNYENIYKKALSQKQRKELKKKFRYLYDTYYKALINNDKDFAICYDFYDKMNNSYKENTKKQRIVIDYIAGMTDNFFEREYKKYTKVNRK